jgi:HK97 family phage prohead protease
VTVEVYTDEQKAFSTFKLKSVQVDRREITGIASTPSTDRQGDQVMPEGAVFALPLPLILEHDVSSPVGQVISAKITSEGIRIKAQIAKADKPGPLADRLDSTFESLKLGLLRGLSIGFRPLKSEPIGRTGGVRFTSWEWLETSLCVVPANQDSQILEVKRADLNNQMPQKEKKLWLNLRSDTEVDAFEKHFQAMRCAWKEQERAEGNFIQKQDLAPLHFVRDFINFRAVETELLLSKRLDKIEKQLRALRNKP